MHGLTTIDKIMHTHDCLALSLSSSSAAFAVALLNTLSGANPIIPNRTACHTQGIITLLPLPIFATTLLANGSANGVAKVGVALCPGVTTLPTSM